MLNKVVSKITSKAQEAILLEANSSWVNKETRATCKYAPVLVPKGQDESAVSSMGMVLQKRIQVCRQMADIAGGRIWFSFQDYEFSHRMGHFSAKTVPIIVISGGSANKLVQELSKDYSLAWHPAIVRDEPVYLLVHMDDYGPYAKALENILSRYKNMRLIGWKCGLLTGFGAARSAALHFADALEYRPSRIILMDQDVVQTEETRHTRSEIESIINEIHNHTQKFVAEYGVGYPTRQPVPLPFSELDPIGKDDLNSPAQQFVSVRAPFLDRSGETIYPGYMVSGGEDMLMGFQLGIMQGDINSTLLPCRIAKKRTCRAC